MRSLEPSADYCYITTVGRVTGNDHTIEIWYAVDERTLYVLAGGRYDADFVRNLMKNPLARVRIGSRRARAQTVTARMLVGGEEDALARRLLLAKYMATNDDLEEWGRTALAVAFDVES